MEAVIHGFPFWMYIDTSSNMAIKNIDTKIGKIRIYPPYRNSPGNFSPLPHIKLKQTPFQFPKKSIFLKDLKQPILVYSLDNSVHLLESESLNNLPKPYTPMDSIRIDFYEEEKVKNSRYEFFKNLIINLRCQSGQWWIERSVESLVGRHTGVSFRINEAGLPISEPSALLNMPVEGIGFEKGINKKIWFQSVYEASLGRVPSVWEQVYLDAAYFHASQDYKLCIINLATACEQVKDATFVRLWKDKYKDLEYDRDHVQGNWDISKHLDVKLKKNFDVSYKEEFLDNWNSIKELWGIRGDVAHGNVTERLVEVDVLKSKSFFEPVRHCMNWLMNLK